MPMEAENIVIMPSAWDALQDYQKEEFGALMWGMGQLYEMLNEGTYNMLEETSFNLFGL